MLKLFQAVGFILLNAGLGCATSVLLQPAPDLMSSNLSARYADGELSIEGLADSFIVYDAGFPTLYGITGGTFEIKAQVSNTGEASTGTLSIHGCVPGLAGTPGCTGPGLLLAGALSYFEYDPWEGGELALGFALLSGDVAPLYGEIAYAKVNIFAFPGTFNQDFNLLPDFTAVADVGRILSPVPEPGTWSLLLLAGVAFISLRARQGAKFKPMA